MIYRQANSNDLPGIKNLALVSWKQFEEKLETADWQKLENSLNDDKTYTGLLGMAYSLICTKDDGDIIGMSFLVPSGNPTDIYEAGWCYIRFVTVHPKYSGKGIGRELTERCIRYAKENGEKIIALHTSEMMDRARHIYESLGFKVLREIEPRFGKKYWLYTLNIS
jgi:ribosomal protein S18 acetylase RimI-like enzyme